MVCTFWACHLSVCVSRFVKGETESSAWLVWQQTPWDQMSFHNIGCDELTPGCPDKSSHLWPVEKVFVLLCWNATDGRNILRSSSPFGHLSRGCPNSELRQLGFISPERACQVSSDSRGLEEWRDILNPWDECAREGVHVIMSLFNGILTASGVCLAGRPFILEAFLFTLARCQHLTKVTYP